MPVKIDCPETAYAGQEISFGGKTYEFTYSLNERDNRVRLDIIHDGEYIISGIKIMENQSLLKRYDLVDFSHGDIYCIRFKEDGKGVTLDNLGINKAYELIYLTNEEILEVKG